MSTKAPASDSNRNHTRILELICQSHQAMETKATNSNLIAKCYADNSAACKPTLPPALTTTPMPRTFTSGRVAATARIRQAAYGETIVPLIYTIASNLIIDYLRRYYRSRKDDDEVAPRHRRNRLHSVESRLLARDMAQAEQRRVECLPRQPPYYLRDESLRGESVGTSPRNCPCRWDCRESSPLAGAT